MGKGGTLSTALIHLITHTQPQSRIHINVKLTLQNQEEEQQLNLMPNRRQDFLLFLLLLTLLLFGGGVVDCVAAVANIADTTALMLPLLLRYVCS